MRTIFPLLVCLLLSVLPVFAKPPAGLQERLDQWIKGQPGGVALAWVDADGVTNFQSGQFSADDPRPVTADTQFEIGSITKVFTSLLLAESERLGKVSRNDPAAKYLLAAKDPDQSALARITLFTLATHTSGLPRLSSNIGPNPDANPDPYAKFDRAMMIEALRKDGSVASAGRSVAYSNFGAAVLGEALGAVWGASYADALRKQVLEPLGMTKTTVGLAGSSTPENFPSGHVLGQKVPPWTFQAYAPAGALRSSAREMALLLTACLKTDDGPLHDAIEATIQPQLPMDEVGGQIGLGWIITDDGVVWHNGATAGSHAFVAFNPKSGIGVVILANVQQPAEALGFGLLGAKTPQPKVSTTKDATDFVGRYPLSPAFAIDVTEINGTLRVQATGQPVFPLRTVAVDRFALVGVPAEISFERDADGKVTALVLHQNGRDQRALRGELPPPPKEEVLPAETLQEYVGAYPLTPQFVLIITATDRALFAQATGQGKARLFASARDEFFYKIVNAQISFQRDSAGEVTGLVLHQNGRDLPAQKTK